MSLGSTKDITVISYSSHVGCVYALPVGIFHDRSDRVISPIVSSNYVPDNPVFCFEDDFKKSMDSYGEIESNENVVFTYISDKSLLTETSLVLIRTKSAQDNPIADFVYVLGVFQNGKMNFVTNDSYTKNSIGLDDCDLFVLKGLYLDKYAPTGKRFESYGGYSLYEDMYVNVDDGSHVGFRVSFLTFSREFVQKLYDNSLEGTDVLFEDNNNNLWFAKDDVKLFVTEGDSCKDSLTSILGDNFTATVKEESSPTQGIATEEEEDLVNSISLVVNNDSFTSSEKLKVISNLIKPVL